MKVALLHITDKEQPHFLLRLFHAGIAACGDSPFYASFTQDSPKSSWKTMTQADVAVRIYHPHPLRQSKISVLNRRLDVKLRQFGKRVITVDAGFLRSQLDHEMRGYRKGRHLFDDKQDIDRSLWGRIYYEVGYDGIKRSADYCNQNSPRSRWKALRMPLSPWRKKGRHVLLCGQKPGGVSSCFLDLYHWYADCIAAIRRATARPIIFRHHPRLFKAAHGIRYCDNDHRLLVQQLASPSDLSWSTKPLLQDDLRDAWAVCASASNATVAAVVAGIPVFTDNEACMAWPVANHDFANIEQPTFPDRQQWAYDLAYAQWNCEEIARGNAWAHLRPYAQRT